MVKSTTPLIKYIPQFLYYCKKDKKLSNNTQESYDRYLKRFTSWLKNINKENLLPNELTSEDIWNYRLFLSRKYKHKGKSLQKTTQNYYLIALRALLSYFTAKDIVSLPTDKIALLKDDRREKTIKFLNLEQIERLLLVPGIKSKTGLRDRAILETIIYTGLKVSEVSNFNRDQVNKEGFFPKESLFWIKKYLETRKDNTKALFVNYRGRNPKSRLTRRSIERIVKKYEREIGLPFSITPEILRWAYARALLEKQKNPERIEGPNTHKIFITKHYESKILKEKSKHSFQEGYSSSNEWHIIENIINKEITWLKDNIPILPEGYKQTPLALSDDYLLRKIAILIVGGRITATEFRAKKNDLWDNLTKEKDLKKISHHGEEWHRKMMNVINEYFTLKDYKVSLEPILHYGRADLGIYLSSKEFLYIEVGTVSLYKLWHNLSSMRNITFLIVPSEKYAIEFKSS